jgi:hypothetical protein
MFAEYEWTSEYDICADMMKHVEVMSNSAKDALRFTSSSRSLRKPGQKFLLSELCGFWKEVLMLPISRASIYDKGSSGGGRDVEQFLIRVPGVVFELKISTDQADRAVRNSLKDSKREFDRYRDG